MTSYRVLSHREVYDQSASPASDASLASPPGVARVGGAPPSHSVVLTHTLLPASSGQHWHFMPHGVAQTSGTALHVAFGMTWLGSGHCCGLQSGQGSGFDVVEQPASRTKRRNLIGEGERRGPRARGRSCRRGSRRPCRRTQARRAICGDTPRALRGSRGGPRRTAMPVALSASKIASDVCVYAAAFRRRPA